MRTIKEEEVETSDYEDHAGALGQLRRFLNNVCMHTRIHSALGHLTPVEFEEQRRREHQQPPDIHKERPQKRPVTWVHYTALQEVFTQAKAVQLLDKSEVAWISS